MKSIFEQEFEVRDYECDLQGIVNNAIYQSYMEYTSVLRRVQKPRDAMPNREK